jgi:hypothetical protein
VRPFKSNSLVLFIVIALLGMIVAVLILPQVDLPDTAFQRNASLQALLAPPHHAPHAIASAALCRQLSQFEDASILSGQVQETAERCSTDLPVEHKSLRC